MLFPIIIPRSYNKDGKWVGPVKNLKHPDLAVTWVVLGEGNTMTYVSHSDVQQFVESGIDYESEALENLRASSLDQLFTHELLEKERLVYAVAMHTDGLGSSRLLLREEWRRIFPQGFLVGLPERSCGFVAPLGQSPDQKRKVLKLVYSCFKDGTTAMLPGLHDPTLFEFE